MRKLLIALAAVSLAPAAMAQNTVKIGVVTFLSGPAAAPFGDTARAVEYNILAARAATDALSFDEAAAQLRTALELGIKSPAERAAVLLEIGTASHRAGMSMRTGGARRRYKMAPPSKKG